MPALSPTMSQGNIAKWHVKEGDEVSPGVVLADIETDKATMAFENQDDGFVARILAKEGSKDIPVGTPVMILVEDRDSISAFKDYSPSGGKGASQPAPNAKQSTPATKPAHAAKAAKPQSSQQIGGSQKRYPPHTMLAMPSLSPTMERGNILSWHMKEGDAVKPGDYLAEVETDKATMAFENQEEGFIAKILKPAGSKDVPVGTPVAIIVEDLELVSMFADYSADAPAASGSAADAESQASVSDSAPETSSKPWPPASSRIGPAARLLLESSGLRREDIIPTGPNSIITKHDVLTAIEAGGKKASGKPSAAAQPPSSTHKQPPAATEAAPAAAAAAAAAAKPAKAAPPESAAAAKATAAPAAPAAGNFTDMPNSQIRKIIAQRLLDSKVTIPAMYVSMDAEVDAVMALRKQLADNGTKVSMNDFVLKAVALALRDVPQANVFWDAKAEQPSQFKSIDVCVAVATDKGLITPILKNTDQKSLAQISAEVRQLAARARENKLKPEEFQGGSFTVSNLGMYGISHFCAIINPPQAAILAVGGTQQRVYLKSGKPIVKHLMSVTLSADNRIYDGQLSSDFLKAVTSHLSSPVNMLI